MLSLIAILTPSSMGIILATILSYYLVVEVVQIEQIRTMKYGDLRVRVEVHLCELADSLAIPLGEK